MYNYVTGQKYPQTNLFGLLNSNRYITLLHVLYIGAAYWNQLFLIADQHVLTKCRTYTFLTMEWSFIVHLLHTLLCVFLRPYSIKQKHYQNIENKLLVTVVIIIIGYALVITYLDILLILCDNPE